MRIAAIMKLGWQNRADHDPKFMIGESGRGAAGESGGGGAGG